MLQTTPASTAISSTTKAKNLWDTINETVDHDLDDVSVDDIEEVIKDETPSLDVEDSKSTLNSGFHNHKPAAVDNISHIGIFTETIKK